MAASKKPADKKPAKKSVSSGVFDVARPDKGSLTPSGTSRPVIIKHQFMSDPMVNQERQADLPVVLKPVRKVVIKPVHDDVVPEEENAEVEPTKTAPKLKPETKPVTQPEPLAEPETEPEPQFSPDTKIADVAPEPDTTAIPDAAADEDEDSEARRIRLAKLQQMIDEEEYFLPIETLEERRSRKVAIFGLILIVLLAAAWYNVALDAGLLPNSFDLPHTTFFSIKP